MLRGLWRLTWLEIKIFVREPMGVIGTLGVPVGLFVIMSRLLRPGGRGAAPRVPAFVGTDLPIFAALLMATSGVLSLVAVIAIYREGGILKRLRATPVKPHTILTAHVIVKLVFTLATLALMVAAGRRYQIGPNAPLASFALAVLLSTLSVLSLGFLIASVVPTARFASPIASAVLYPMLGLSALFVPIDALPPALQRTAHVLPLTYAVSLLRGIWRGDAWSAHLQDVAALVAAFLILTALSAKVFRWE